MWFLTGFIGTPVVVGIINALLTALMSVASTRHSRRKLLLGAKEHLVFFGVLGVGEGDVVDATVVFRQPVAFVAAWGESQRGAGLRVKGGKFYTLCVMCL